MSLTKRSLPVDVDVTDVRDTGNYGEPDEPTASDWAISELFNAVGTLEKHGAAGYITDLKSIRRRLQDVIDNTLKPF